jgi:hypothetical protein
MLTKDYRGLKLCEACWNGNHFVRKISPPEVICACLRMGCQCPCSIMELDKASIAATQRRFRKANLQLQAQIPDTGAGYSHINPQDRKVDGRNQ